MSAEQFALKSVIHMCSFVKFVLRLESQRSDFADFSVFIGVGK